MRLRVDTFAVPIAVGVAVASCCGLPVLADKGGGNWFLLAVPVFAGLVVVSLRELYQTDRRRRLGLCLHCGYDLRASPGRCPECGTATNGFGDLY